MDENASYIITMNISSFVNFLEALNKMLVLEDSFVPYSFALFHRSSMIEHGIWDEVKVDFPKEFNLICHTHKIAQVSFSTNSSEQM